MEFTQIPGTSLRASRIALGTWAIGGWMWGGSDETDAIRTIHKAMDSGINLIDTAPVYGFGHSEEIVGKALAKGGRRARTLIATKVGLDWTNGKPFRNAQKARIIEEVESSLRRLQTDVIDLYQGSLARPEHVDRGSRGNHGSAASRRQDPSNRRQQFQPEADG
jgi:aryl-alcohol dehydrogenase-like predicted oxidoreductase